LLIFFLFLLVVVAAAAALLLLCKGEKMQCSHSVCALSANIKSKYAARSTHNDGNNSFLPFNIYLMLIFFAFFVRLSLSALNRRALFLRFCALVAPV